MELRLKTLIGGLTSHVPPLFDLLRAKNEGASRDPAYCYGVWTSHWHACRAAGMETTPATVLELGPGGSVGVGLCALLCGAERAWALDVDALADVAGNLQVLDGLVPLIRAHRGAPLNGDGAPLLSEDEVAALTAPDRVAGLAEAVRRVGAGTADADSPIRYFAPWGSADIVPAASVDLIISQSVMEHVEDVAGAHTACVQWLKPGGWVRHSVDLRCHDTTQTWNGHYVVGDTLWALAKGRRGYLINRLTPTEHQALVMAAGLEIVAADRVSEVGGVAASDLAPRFRGMTDEDRTCRRWIVTARRPA